MTQILDLGTYVIVWVDLLCSFFIADAQCWISSTALTQMSVLQIFALFSTISIIYIRHRHVETCFKVVKLGTRVHTPALTGSTSQHGSCNNGFLPVSFPLRWRTSACRSCCPCSNTPCHTCTRSLSSTRRSWRAVTLTPVSRPCLWMKPTCKCLLMLLWAFSGKHEVVCDLVQVKPSWNLSYFQLFLCLSARTCSTALWSSTRLRWPAAVSLRLWLSSFLAVSSPGCHGKSEKTNVTSQSRNIFLFNCALADTAVLWLWAHSSRKMFFFPR